MTGVSLYLVLFFAMRPLDRISQYDSEEIQIPRNSVNKYYFKVSFKKTRDLRKEKSNTCRGAVPVGRVHK